MYPANCQMFAGFEAASIVLVAVIAAMIFWKLFMGFWTCWLGHALGFGVEWLPGKDNWAVITGSTDGIGLEYARRLADIGYSVMLISRNPNKLKVVAERIRTEFVNCQQVKTLAVDFRYTDIYDKIQKELLELGNIDVLINNVGISQKPSDYFTMLPKNTIENNFNVNMISLTKMIELVLPSMVIKGRGIILNLSSLAGAYPTPLMAVYSAGKAYIDFLSRALSIEYGSKGIVIQAVLPGLVDTPGAFASKVKAPMSVKVEDFVNASLKTIGIEDRTYGHWKHKLLGFIQDFFVAPIFGDKKCSQMAMNCLLKSRDDYYKSQNIDFSV